MTIETEKNCNRQGVFFLGEILDKINLYSYYEWCFSGNAVKPATCSNQNDGEGREG